MPLAYLAHKLRALQQATIHPLRSRQKSNDVFSWIEQQTARFHLVNGASSDDAEAASGSNANKSGAQPVHGKQSPW